MISEKSSVKTHSTDSEGAVESVHINGLGRDTSIP